MSSDHTPSENDWACTDTGNKDRFVRQWQGKLIFLQEPKQWAFWDDDKWTTSFDIYAKAEETMKSIFVEAGECRDRDGSAKLGKWALASHRTAYMDSMLRRAAGPLSKSLKQFDTDPYLINCKNGIVDLRTKEFRKRTPDDRCLQMTAADYDPEAKCPEWLEFLESVHERDKDVIKYLQLLYGYSITGLVKDHHFVILYGDGRNGKDTEADTIRQMLGDYGATIEFAVFLERGASNARIKEAIGNLKGKRFTLASEAERNSTFNAAHIKSHTGGNERKGAVIHGKAFDYDPTDKLWLSTNYLPIVHDTTIAFWDRVIVVPFNKQYLDDVRNTDLKETLKQEWAGIFNWALEGAHRYLSGEKLHTKPQAVIDATKEYEYLNDDLKRFIATRLVPDKDAKVGRMDMHQEYSEWFKAQDNLHGVEPCPLKYFRERMGKRRVRSKDINGSGFFVGYRLKEDTAEPASAPDLVPQPYDAPTPRAFVKPPNAGNWDYGV